MKIDELVEQLQEIRETFGNLQVRTFDEYECINYVGEPHVKVNDVNAPSWATDEDLADDELYVSI